MTQRFDTEQQARNSLVAAGYVQEEPGPDDMAQMWFRHGFRAVVKQQKNGRWLVEHR